MKNTNKKVRVLAAVFAAVMMLSTALAFTGCKGNDDKKAEAVQETVAATVKATDAPKADSASKLTDADDQDDQDVQESTAQSNDDEGATGSMSYSTANGYNVNEAWYAGVSEQAAGQTALKAVGGNSRINFSEPGTYDEQECWIVYVTDQDAGVQYACFVGDGFCEVTSDDTGHTVNDAYYAGISQQAATQEAIKTLGGDNTEGIKAENAETGYYQGQEAWVIHLSNADGSGTVAYVSADFCNFE